MKSKYHLTRECAICNKILYYSCRESYIIADKNNGLCKSCAVFNRNLKQNNLEVLLDNSLTSYYWIGFILADGHIENNRRLQITLALKDIEHLKKFSEYVSCNMYIKTQCSVSPMHGKAIKELSRIFDINPNKTIHPPKIEIFENLNRDQLLALFAGFIDGDGCIKNLHKRKDFQLAIKCHKSWLPILNYFGNSIFSKKYDAKINTAGYTTLMIGDSQILKDFKKQILLLNLPLLERKWDIIDFNFISRCEEAISRKKHFLKLVEDDKTLKEIAIDMKLSIETIRYFNRKYIKNVKI